MTDETREALERWADGLAGAALDRALLQARRNARMAQHRFDRGCAALPDDPTGQLTGNALVAACERLEALKGLLWDAGWVHQLLADRRAALHPGPAAPTLNPSPGGGRRRG